MIERKTIFSPCRKYRYTLWRSWADDLFRNKTKEGFVQFIGLNPSTADETLDDPTIRKCMGFAKRWGYLTICMTNLFAWRSTDPRRLIDTQDPVGDYNNHWLTMVALEASMIVCAWGVRGGLLRQDWHVRGLIGDRAQALRLTKDNHPEHPLYVPYSVEPIHFPKNDHL